MRPSQSRVVGLLCLLVTSVGWGLNWPAMKLLMQEAPPLASRGAAGLTAAAVLASLAVVRRESPVVPRHLLTRFAMAATWMVNEPFGASESAALGLTLGGVALSMGGRS